MLVYIALALFNGMVVGTSRAVNGQLSTEIGPLRASLWNHVVGFVFLTLALAALGEWRFHGAGQAPLTAYLGGLFGALFVAVNSYIFPRIGAMNAALLVISGQMISSVLIDYANQSVAPTPLRWLGVGVVLFGVYLSTVAKRSRDEEKEPA